MFVKTDVLCALVILISVVFESEPKFCERSYLKNAQINFGWKENFEYYNWRTFQQLEGRVKFLKIQNQDVKHVCKFYLSDSVMEVILIKVNLEYIQPGFFTSYAIEQVFIQLNNLKYIQAGVFSDTVIKSLVLSENNIEYIEPRAFENMTKLEAIALDYNNIKEIDPSWFVHTRSLYEVLLNHNQLTELPEDTTRHLVESFEKDFYKMFGCIDFDNNKIKYIHPNAFSNLRNFGVVSLSNNELLELPKDVFVRFQFLLSLYMNTNNFICFDNATVNSFHGVKRLFLANNKMNEDCKTRIKEYFDTKSDLVYV